jgi:hypothetical protein
MKKLFLVSAILLSAVAFFSCKNKSAAAAEDPKVVLAAFFDAVSKKDMTTAKSLATPESQMMLTLIESKITENSEMMTKYDKSKIKFGEATITGDNATVPLITENSSVGFPLKKIDGEWKVDFSINSMINSNMDKMKERRVERGLEKLKDLNVDSLAKEMLRKNDSAKEALKKIK